MKSDAGCSTIRDRPPDGGVSVSAPNWAFDGAAAAGRAGGSGGCGSATDGWVTSAAAPAWDERVVRPGAPVDGKKGGFLTITGKLSGANATQLLGLRLTAHPEPVEG